MKKIKENFYNRKLLKLKMILIAVKILSYKNGEKLIYSK